MPSFEEDITIFDLPSLRGQPTFEVLHRTLQFLEVKPSSWGVAAGKPNGGLSEAEVSRYLTGIVSNLFEWFDSSEDGDVEEKKEILWELASKRVTERCGRTAIGELNRTWTIPASKQLPELSFDIREPPLTGDNLGFKTWGTAYTLSKKLEYIGNQFLGKSMHGDATVLELGAGTGLVGLTAAAVWSTNVFLTDLEEIRDNLDHNIQQNLDTVMAQGGDVSGHTLDWTNPTEFLGHLSQGFDIVIAADSLYDDEHPILVSSMIQTYLKRDANSHALVAVPLRDKNTQQMVDTLKQNLKSVGVDLLHEDWEICRDDWETSGDEGGVRCWWALFVWASDIANKYRRSSLSHD